MQELVLALLGEPHLGREQLLRRLRDLELVLQPLLRDLDVAGQVVENHPVEVRQVCVRGGMHRLMRTHLSSIIKTTRAGGIPAVHECPQDQGRESRTARRQSLRW